MRENENEKVRVIVIVACYSAVSTIRAHCSSIVNYLAYTIFDGASFWVINAKKREHLLAYAILIENALRG